MSEHLDSTELGGDGGNSVCPACGQRFDCAAASGETQCWCVQLPAATTLEAGGSCYCPHCLQEHLAKQRAASGSA